MFNNLSAFKDSTAAKLSKRVLAEDGLEEVFAAAAALSSYVKQSCIHDFDYSVVEDFIFSKAISFGATKLQSLGHAKRSELVLLTCAYKTGGHTRLAEHLFSGRDCDVLVLKVANRANLALEQGGPSVALGQGLLNDIKALAQVCAGYRRVVHMLHPDDWVGAVALEIARREAGTDVFLLDHADHIPKPFEHQATKILTLGLAGQNRLLQRGLTKTGFVGIPIAGTFSPESFGKRYAKPQQVPEVVSGGNAWKYRLERRLKFGELIKRICLRANPPPKISIVGPPAPRWLAKQANVRFSTIMPKEQYAKRLRSSDVYIDSWPCCGGTAFCEAFLHNVLVLGFRENALGMSPIDQIRFADDAEMADCVVDPDARVEFASRILGNADQIIAQIETWHDVERVRTRVWAMLDAVSDGQAVPSIEGVDGISGLPLLKQFVLPPRGRLRRFLGMFEKF